MTDQTLIKLSDVMKSYDAPDGAEKTWILEDLSLEVKAGEALAVIGPSGSGKSTLLNIIGTLDRPDAGSVRIGEQEMTTLQDEALAAARIKDIGFIFQLHHLLPQCTVLENVLLPTLPKIAGGKPGNKQVWAEELLRKLGLEERMNYRPGQLSGGERQRAAVARALINQPRILLADEPTGSLDRQAAENLIELLIKLNKEEKITLVVVTHSEALAGKMDKVLKLADGRLV